VRSLGLGGDGLVVISIEFLEEGRRPPRDVLLANWPDHAFPTAKGYHIAPHTHPKPEVVTILSGTLLLGMGETADQGKAKALPAGSFFAMEPGMAHYVYADEETVLQLNSTGPWSLNYVNAKDDPRQKTQ
jgi:hypothetical protein